MATTETNIPVPPGVATPDRVEIAPGHAQFH